MKRILSVLSLVLITAVSQAQTLGILRANITNFRTYNNTQITTKTGPRSITPINVGGNIDSAMRYIDSALNYTASVGDWQSSLAINNIATITPYLTGGALYDVAGTGTERSHLAPNDLSMWNSAGGGFAARLKSSVTTSHKIFYLPNYAIGNSTDDALVTHRQNAAISVVSGTNGAVMAATQFDVSNATTAATTLTPNKIQFHNSANPSGSVNGSIVSDVLSASRIYYLPDESAGNTLDDAIVLHKTANPITVAAGNNIASISPAAISLFDIVSNDATTILPNILRLHDGANSGSVFTEIKSKILPATSIIHFTNEWGGDIVDKYSGHVSANPAGGSLNFPHGLPFTPTAMFFTPRNAAARAALADYFATYGSVNGVLTFGTPVFTTIDFDWFALP